MSKLRFKCLGDNKWYIHRENNHEAAYFSNKSHELISNIEVTSIFLTDLLCYNNFLKEINMDNHIKYLSCDNIKLLGPNSTKIITFRC